MKINDVVKNEVLKSDPVENIEDKIEHLFDSLDINRNTRKEYVYYTRPLLDFIKDNGFHNQSFLDYKRFLSAKTNLAISRSIA